MAFTDNTQTDLEVDANIVPPIEPESDPDLAHSPIYLEYMDARDIA